MCWTAIMKMEQKDIDAKIKQVHEEMDLEAEEDD